MYAFVGLGIFFHAKTRNIISPQKLYFLYMSQASKNSSQPVFRKGVINVEIKNIFFVFEF